MRLLSEPNRKFTFTADKPFKLSNRMTFSPRDNGTRIDVVLEGDVENFFKVAEPLVAAMARRQLAADYASLKVFLEAGGAATSSEPEAKTEA